jgi:spermidine synthase
MSKIYETYSKINGRVEVSKELIWGTSIKCGGLTQSGSLIESIWKKPLKIAKNKKPQINNCLILGLGGGSSAKLVRKAYPAAKIVGVDLDPIMVELGKKYLQLDKSEVDIKIVDAFKFTQKTKEKFDLILVDLYQGRQTPEEFTTSEFINMVNKILNTDGVALFNKLYGGDARPAAVKFLKKLESVFGNVDPVYPLANVVFICS